MTLNDAPPTRPTADWISRYAAGLLSSTPGMRPLDAVRLAMDASAGAAANGTRQAKEPSAHRRAGQR